MTNYIHRIRAHQAEMHYKGAYIPGRTRWRPLAHVNERSDYATRYNAELCRRLCVEGDAMMLEAMKGENNANSD